MDTTALVSINGELPKEEVIESKLPPLLGPLLENDSNSLSFKYSNVLELETCKFTNLASSKDFGTFSIGHKYNVHSIYSNKYIIEDTLKYESRPKPGGDLEKVPWVDMTYYQIAKIINTQWHMLFGTRLLELNNNKSIELTLPSGIGIFFCHSVVWKVLGLYDAIVKQKHKVSYNIQTPAEATKFRGMTGKITGITNRSSNQNLVVTGTPLTYARLSKQFSKTADTLKNDSSTIRHTYFFGIVMFANTILHYNTLATYTFPLELIPFSSKFIDSFKQYVTEYCLNNISELVDDEGNNEPTIAKVCKDTLVINIESYKYMMINIGEMYAKKEIVIVVAFSKSLQRFLGGKKSIDIKDGVIINSTDHNEVIQRNVFKYPFYLLLLSTDERNDFRESMIDSKSRNIIAIIHSEKEFSTTQNLIKLRPSAYNRLVLRVVNNEFKPLTETVFYNIIFRFRREFIDTPLTFDIGYWI